MTSKEVEITFRVKPEQAAALLEFLSCVLRADRWRELKRHITRIKDGLDLARIELESLERGAPQTKEIVGKALQHVRFGLDEKTG